jgi:hypothetical protein
LVLVVAGLLALAGAITAPASAEQPVDPGNSADAPGQANDNGGPGGNNGVIKVDGVAVDEVGGGPEGAPGRSHRDNEPHVSCVFNVDWYGYESGAGETDVSFQLWGPNKGYELEADTNLADNGTGNADDQDNTVEYDLSAAIAEAVADGQEPNDQQGWLVKVTVNTPGLSHGADVKHKVFWVDDCGTTTTSNPPRNPSGPGVPLVLGQEVTTTTTVAPTTTAAPDTTAAPTTEATVLGVQLARTGVGTPTFLAVAGLLLLVGGAALLAGKREVAA